MVPERPSVVHPILAGAGNPASRNSKLPLGSDFAHAMNALFFQLRVVTIAGCTTRSKPTRIDPALARFGRQNCWKNFEMVSPLQPGIS